MTTWFTADLHLGHENILKYCKRPFENVAIMDSEIISRWNSVVAKNDVVWVLGDFAMTSSKERIGAYWVALNGNKHLIPGGHDKQKTTFKPIEEREIEGYTFVMCHYPLEEWNKEFYNAIHLHGHTHVDGKLLPKPNRVNVCADLWNFYPVSISQILEKVKENK